MNDPITIAIIGVVSNFIIALGGWIFAWKQGRDNQRRQQRQQKVDHVLKHLDEFAELTSLYRILANFSEKIVTDEEGQFLRDDSGSYVKEIKSLFPDEIFDEAMKETEGKNTRDVIKLQLLRIHRQ